jgi:hypothetical protein
MPGVDCQNKREENVRIKREKKFKKAVGYSQSAGSGPSELSN